MDLNITRTANTRTVQTQRLPRTWPCIVVILLVGAAVFSNTLHNGMHLDDFPRIADNPENDQFWPPWRHFFDRETNALGDRVHIYRPLPTLSLTFSKLYSDTLGMDPLAGYHLGNIATHLATSVLLFFFFRELLGRFGKPRSDRLLDPAFISTLLFAVHPISGVPVNYLCARDLLLMLFFLVASLLVYTRMRRLGETRWRWAAVLALFALSLLSKKNGVALPALILFWEVVVEGRSMRSVSTWLRPAAFAVIVAALFAWIRFGLGVADEVSEIGGTSTPWLYGLTMLELHFFYYLRNFLWPFVMRTLPDIPMAPGLDWKVLIGGLFIFSTLVLAWRLKNRAPAACWTILAYWVLFAPTSSILPYRFIATDYRQYPSLAFLCLGLALAMDRIPMRHLSTTLFVTLTVYFSASTYLHTNPIWKTEFSLWHQSVQYGGDANAHMNYGLSVKEQDSNLAEKHFKIAIEKVPNHVYAHLNLGLLYLAHEDRFAEGLAYLQRSVELGPTVARPHAYLAMAYRKMGKEAEALAEILKAADLEPDNPELQYQAARDLQWSGNHLASLDRLERLTKIYPEGYKNAHFFKGVALQQLGRWPEAENSYQAQLKQYPQDAVTRFNLGVGLLQAGRHQQAIAALQRSLKADPQLHEVHELLAECYEALGNHTKAAYYRNIFESLTNQ